MRASTSSLGTTCSHVSSRMSPTGISSMKRTCHGCVEREAREVLDLVVVDPAHHDDVDLDRVEPRVLGRARGGDRVEAEVARAIAAMRSGRSCRRSCSRDRGPPSRSDRASSGSFTPFVESAMSSISGTARSMRDQRLEVGPDRRLAAGDAQAAQAERRELPRRPRRSPRT